MPEAELWRPVFGYEGYYEVSNLGGIKSLHKGKVRIRSLGKDTDGYYQVDLYKNGDGSGKVKKVHILVLEAFVCPRPVGMMGLHNDGNPQNNHLTNLRWGTQSENEQDKKNHGTDGCGSRNGSAKLGENDVIEIRRLLSLGVTQVNIASQFKITQAQVSQIKLRIKWSHLPI